MVKLWKKINNNNNMEKKDLPIPKVGNNEPKLKWEFSRMSKALTYRLGDEPHIVHFIRTGFTDKPTYHVIEEDAWELKPNGKDFLMDSLQIKARFGIDIDLDFQKYMKLPDISDDDIINLMDKHTEIIDGVHNLDLLGLISIVGRHNAARVHELVRVRSQEKNIIIMTAKQESKNKW